MWKHKNKHKGHLWRGRYKRQSYGDRIFELVNQKTGRIISFESFQMARKLGWVKIK
jgi:hypothetical protein